MNRIFSACIWICGASLSVMVGAQSVPPPRSVEGAVLSSNVYDLPIPGNRILMTEGARSPQQWQAPQGYRVVGALGNDQSGFQGAIYQSGATHRYTVVYRGTQPGEAKDLSADVDIVRQRGPQFEAQLGDARKLTDHAIQTYGRDNVTIAGHSLGGAIAQVESARTGLLAETYNAPGMHEYIQERYPNARLDRISNNSRADDTVSSVGTRPGYDRTYREVSGVLDSHSIAGFAQDLSAGAMPIDAPSFQPMQGKAQPVDQWGDGGATARRMEFQDIARKNADDARARAVAAAAAATLSNDPSPPDPVQSFLSTLTTIQGIANAAGSNAATPRDATGAGKGASCPKKPFSTPDGCHPGHDEKAHPGGCYCG